MQRRLFLALAASAAIATPARAVVTFEKGELTIESDGKSHRFAIEIARTPEQAQQGLMFRTRLAPDAGMLFLYDPPQPVAMWMFQTLIPLDMLFLELNGGTVARLKLKPGDRVRHPEIAK
jgi:uncharacterized membrane protein (UPF0127 family)